ncbi:unnamed protein product [Arabidopsis halleri]
MLLLPSWRHLRRVRCGMRLSSLLSRRFVVLREILELLPYLARQLLILKITQVRIRSFKGERRIS